MLIPLVRLNGLIAMACSEVEHAICATSRRHTGAAVLPVKAELFPSHPQTTPAKIE